MPAGAPRTVSPDAKECEKLGKELVKWVVIEDPEDPRLIFSQWYSLEKTILRKTWKTLVQVKEFLPYYEKAKAVLAKRCMNGTMEKSFGHRYIRLYDSELRNDENELLKLKAELAKAQDKEEVAENVIRKLAQVVKAAEEKENGDG